MTFDEKTLLVASLFFALAVLHTFLAPVFSKISTRFRDGSIGENFFHFLSEVEIVFGFWAFLFILYISLTKSTATAVEYLNTLNYSEAIFVFVIMAIMSTRPVLFLTKSLIFSFVKLFPFQKATVFYCVTLILGPLVGSFITEPAAMTVCALLLKEAFFDKSQNATFKYATLGLLFVNVSIGGTLTSFAAPPVLMVAQKWNFDSSYMLSHFGYKAAIATALNTFVTAFFFRNELKTISINSTIPASEKAPWWLVVSHIAIAIAVIAFHAAPAFIVPLFLIFIGWVEVTAEYQQPLKIRESLLVGFFLGGLVTLGQLQGWWLQPLLSKMSATVLFFGATALTGVTDNAALTYLGSLAPDLTDAAKYALLAGAVTGGGLTVIANAPNPAGYGILRDSFEGRNISAVSLFIAALPFTCVAAVSFLFL